MELPNLEGQPAWVVIIVVFLITAGPLGLAYLRRKSAPEPDEEPQIEGTPAKVALPAGDSFDPVREAMGMVATQAARSAEDADRAEEEVRRVSQQLAECERDRAVMEERYQTLLVQLQNCQRRLNQDGIQ